MEILPQLLVNALIAGSIYALASSGLALSYGLLRILNFAHGHLMMAGAYIFFLFYAARDWNGQPIFGWSLLPAGVATALLVAVLGAVSLEIFVLPFTRYSLMLSFVTTLALSTILESCVSMIAGVNVRSLTIGMEIRSLEIAGVYITPVQIVIIASALGLLLVLAAIVHLTPFGRKIRAISEHEYAAMGLGVNKQRISYAVFVAATLLAAFAGILVGFETNMQPTMGSTYTIKAFAAMVLGGLGSIWGTVAGSYLLGLIENLSIGLDLGDFIRICVAGAWAAFGLHMLIVRARSRSAGKRVASAGLPLAAAALLIPIDTIWHGALRTPVGLADSNSSIGNLLGLFITLACAAALFMLLIEVWKQRTVKLGAKAAVPVLLLAATALALGGSVVWGDASIPAGYKDAFAFMIILLLLLFRPHGLFKTGVRTA